MKKTLFTLLMTIICVTSFAQTQQGIVKTRGRMVNGQLVAGQKLAGATITLNFGNALVSGSQGGFSFNVPNGKTYSLVMAKKQGYTLADPEFTRRSFKYSASNPFYVVLENETQRQADINAATRNVRRTLTAQLQKREDEIEALKKQNKLTEAEYHKKLQELYDNQSKSEQLVKEMAERYASTDYDQLDDFNRQVQMYIEEGELQKADSMIRCKGDMEQRVAEYHNVVAANKKVREDLEKSESGAAKTYEDLSQDLYHRHEIFLQNFQQDSALYCLKLRADLDTTNLDAVLSYAYLCHIQNKFSDCEQYYMIGLRMCTLNENVLGIAYITNSLGDLYGRLHDYINSEKYLKQALEHLELLFSQNPDAYRANLAMTQNNLGNLYHALHDYSSSEKYYKQALENREQLFAQYPDAYRADLAMTQNNFGNLYHALHDYASSEKYYKQALEHYEHLFAQNSDAYRADLAMTQSNLGFLYNFRRDYASSEKYYKLALEHFEQLFVQNPDAYRANLAGTQNDLGGLYINLHDFISSEKYNKLALEHFEQLFVQNPDAYRDDLAGTLNNLGVLYFDLHDYANSEKYNKLALELREHLFAQNPDAYRNVLAGTQNNLGNLYLVLGDLASSEKYYKLALEHRELLFAQNPDAYRFDLAMTLNNYSLTYSANQKFDEAIEAIDKAISLFSTIADFYDSKGEILLIQGKNQEALSMWKKVLDLNPDFLKDNPDGTNLSNGLKKLGLIE